MVKVCCIQSAAEVRMALEAGATHVGLVGSMPSGPGPMPDEAIARIAAEAPMDVTTVLLTSRAAAADIAEHVIITGVDAVQIVREVPAGVRHAVRQALPGIRILQVVHVDGPGAVARSREAAEGADYLLLDSGRPATVPAELGGTGRTHDWTVSAEIVRRSSVPVFLAGGLGPGTVADALGAVRPAGVDLCSGIRDGKGRLDPASLNAFMAAVREHSAAIPPPAAAPRTEVSGP